jgi:hypothetical protein
MDSADVSTPAAPAPAIASPMPTGDRCASCGAPLALDQRYCLQCGERRGEPRLPFMDAATLMEAVRQPRPAPPPPPPKKRRGISPNAALVTGVGVLLLALGIGVLIGQSGNEGTVASAPQAPQIITVGGGGAESGGEEAAAKSKAAVGGSGKAPKSKAEKAKAAKEAETQAGAEEVLKPTGDVKLPPAKVQPGGDCEAGAAGCEGGEFTGDFFSE